MRSMLLRSFGCAAVLWAAGAVVSVAEGSVTFTGSGVNPINNNNPIAGSVEFAISGNALIVTLTNTATSDVTVPSDVLTAVFWSMNIGASSLTRTSGLLAPGSTVFYDPDGQPAGGVIGGEWAYRSGLSFNGASFGISSTGIDLFGPGDLFPGPDLAPPTSPDGLQYGLLSAGDNTATGNGGITGSGGLIKNAVVFTLTGLPANFSLDSISNVLLQYGTDVSEPRIPAVPAPGVLGLLAAGGVMAARRRR
ncbi:MAG: hypothetical protein KF745_03605 [Phycisphaeraceae bacterium]|nr:hypothetical protein [Phycisphaeraceae bacterium]